ncbi:MAG: hypothetical protein HDR27_11055 [Lachnospiraceae bacterium]|nr:hypothetical protein [Lachnospiraceae bacterium]
MSYTKEVDYTFMMDDDAVVNPLIFSIENMKNNEIVGNWSIRKALMPDRNAFMESVFLTKQQEQDKTIEELTKKVEENSRKIDDINFKVHTVIPKGYNYREDLIDVIRDGIIMNKSAQMNMISHMITEVQKLEGLEDSRDQVEYCAHICKDTLEFLKNNPVSNSENYCAKVLHLFYQAIKRNYAKNFFTSEQVHLMLDMLEECKNGFVDKDKYWEFDERLYNAHLSVFPEED